MWASADRQRKEVMASKSVLHVGCGPKTLRQMPDGFQDGSWSEVRFDIDPSVRPDIIGTLTDMAAVQSGTMDAVFSSHNVEHLFAHEVPIAFREFHRVLKDDGFALITCPNIQALGERIAAGQLLEPVYHSARGPISPLDIVFGHRASIAEGNQYMAHRTAFTPQMISDLLQAAGFGSIAVGTRDRRLNIWAYASRTRLNEETIMREMKRFFPSA